MNGLLTFLGLVIVGLVVFAVPPLVVPYAADYGTVTIFDTSKAVLLCGAVALLGAWFISQQGTDRHFLLKVFIAGLLVRMVIGTAIFVFRGQDFFGGDAITYDFFGNLQLNGWFGDNYSQSLVDRFVGKGEGSGWGMLYFVATVYGLIGRNMLAIQFLNAILGAITSVIIFLCAQQVFGNLRVSRLAAVAVAFYPSLVLWSSQGLKDAPIVFFLSVSILATLKLGEKITARWVIALIVSVFTCSRCVFMSST